MEQLKRKLNSKNNFEIINLSYSDGELVCRQIAKVKLARKSYYILQPTNNASEEALVFHFNKNSIELLKDIETIDAVFDKYKQLLLKEIEADQYSFLKSTIPCVSMGERDEAKLLNLKLRVNQHRLEMFRKEVANVVGQAHVIKKLEGYLNSYNEEGKLPKSLFFAGAPGVGKTMLAENLAKALDLPVLFLSMAQYSDKEAYCFLFSMNRSYREAHLETLSKFIEENPRSIIVFDEIEKVHTNVLNAFLNILSQGFFHDNYLEKDIDCSEITFVFTSNLGADIYDDGFNLANVPENKILDAIKNEINPLTKAPYLNAALLDRLAGNIVMFNKLCPCGIFTILKDEIERVRVEFEKLNNIVCDIDAIALAYVFLLEQNPNRFSIRSAKKKIEQFFNTQYQAMSEELLTQDEDGYFETIESDFDLSKIDELLQKQKQRILLYSNSGIKLSNEENVEFIYADRNTDLLKVEDVSTIILDIGNCEQDMADAKCTFDLLIARENVPIYVMAQAEFVQKKHFDYFMSQGAADYFCQTDEGNTIEDWLCSLKESFKVNAIFNQLQKRNSFLNTEISFTIDSEKHKATMFIADTKVKRAETADASLVTVATIPNVSFDDVIGDKDISETMKTCAGYLSDFSYYKRQGVEIPAGILLSGLPGTGKTLRAKALANYANLPFIEMNATELLQRYVGEGPQKLREAYRTLRKSGAGVLFIDEIDTILRSRGSENMHHYDELCNTLLSLMDGFKESKYPVLVIGATNEPIGKDSKLDAAALRRFDYKFTLNLPKVEDREIFLAKVLNSKKNNAVSDEMLHNVAVRAIGWNLSDLNKVVQNAHREAVKQHTNITDSLFNEFFESYAFGTEKHWDKETIKKTAIHEAGHALISALLGNTPAYTTIVSRGEFGGYTLPSEEDVFDYSKQKLLDKICTLMGGRAAEVYFYKDGGINTGARSDIKQATNTATAMVCDYGMVEDFMFYSSVKDSQWVCEKVNRLLKEQYERATQFIYQYQEKITEIANELVLNGSLTQEQMQQIIFKGDKQ